MHLFNKENIWLNQCSFLYTSSHPDKYNNSVDRIISKEKEREDPRRDSSKTFISTTVFYMQSSEDPRRDSSFQVFPHAIQQLQVLFPHLILHTELILPQRNYNYKAHSMQIVRRHPPATAPHASKHSTWQKQGSKCPAVFQGPYSTGRLPIILPGRNSILCGRQHPRAPYSSSQAKST